MMNNMTARRSFPRNIFKGWRQRSKYNRVQRAHPFKASEDACRWEAITTPRGRKIMVALP